MKFKYTGIVILIVLMTFLSAGCGSSGGGGDDDDDISQYVYAYGPHPPAFGMDYFTSSGTSMVETHRISC